MGEAYGLAIPTPPHTRHGIYAEALESAWAPAESLEHSV
jgi:hypothetical protein